MLNQKASAGLMGLIVVSQEQQPAAERAATGSWERSDWEPVRKGLVQGRSRLAPGSGGAGRDVLLPPDASCSLQQVGPAAGPGAWARQGN